MNFLLFLILTSVVLAIMLVIFIVFIILWLIAHFTKKDYMKIRMGKKVRMMSIIVIATACVLGGAFLLDLFFLPVSTYPVNVNNIKGSDSCYSDVYANDSDIYINLSRSGIYRYISDDNLALVRDLGDDYLLAMACTNQYIVFIDSNQMSYRLDIKTKEETQLFNKEVNKIYANGDDYFLAEKDGTLWLFEGDSTNGININKYMRETCDLTDKYTDISCTYGDYTIYGSSEDEEVNIYLLERGDWQAAVGGYETCKAENGAAYFVFSMSSLKDGYSALLHYDDFEKQVLTGFDMEQPLLDETSVMNDNKIYSLIKYGLEWDNHPRAWVATKEALVMIPLAEHEKDQCIVSFDDKRVHIVGVDAENQCYYLYKTGKKENSGKIYRVDIDSGQETLLMDKIDVTDTLYFSWAGDRLFILRENNGHTLLEGTVK